MTKVEVQKMLEHVMDGVDTELGEGIYEFNCRLTDAVRAMDVGTKFTDGHVICKKVNDELVEIYVSELNELIEQNLTRGSGGLAAFWSNSFGELAAWVDNNPPIIPNESLHFKLIEEG